MIHLILLFLFSPTHPHPLPPINSGEADTFPGFHVTHSMTPFSAQLPRHDLTHTLPFKLKSQPPHLTAKPDSSYLFPYLFPGASFPGFTVVGGLIPPVPLPLVPLPVGQGISRPLQLQDLGSKPWSIKEDMVKPIKDVVKYNVSVSAPGVVSVVSLSGQEEELVVFLKGVLGRYQPSNKPTQSASANKTTSKSKTRPDYGIQKDELSHLTPPPRPPLISSILNPLGSLPSFALPPIKWSSFTNLIRRIVGGQGQGQDQLRLDQDQDQDPPAELKAQNCGVDQPNTQPICGRDLNGCDVLCGRNGFVGGACVEGGKCVCHLEKEGRFGLLLKREKTEEAVDCGLGCRNLGAYSGFCGDAGHCYCAVPWLHGELF